MASNVLTPYMPMLEIVKLAPLYSFGLCARGRGAVRVCVCVCVCVRMCVCVCVGGVDGVRKQDSM